MHQAEIIVLLFAAVAGLAVVARKLALPYPVVLVLAGLALSFIPHLPQVRLDPNLVFFFFLPPLIYPAALFTCGGISGAICDQFCCSRSAWFFSPRSRSLARRIRSRRVCRGQPRSRLEQSFPRQTRSPRRV